MPDAKSESIESVLAYARSLPDFPNKALILQRLETGNLNRYQEAMLNLNETLAADDAPIASTSGEAVTRQQLEVLLNKIARLEAKDIVAE